MAIAHQEANELPDEEYPFLLNTGRKLFHYNVFTQNSEALESYSPEELAEINPLDAKRLSFEEGERVKVTSRRGALVETPSYQRHRMILFSLNWRGCRKVSPYL